MRPISAECDKPDVTDDSGSQNFTVLVGAGQSGSAALLRSEHNVMGWFLFSLYTVFGQHKFFSFFSTGTKYSKKHRTWDLESQLNFSMFLWGWMKHFPFLKLGRGFCSCRLFENCLYQELHTCDLIYSLPRAFENVNKTSQNMRFAAAYLVPCKVDPGLSNCLLCSLNYLLQIINFSELKTLYKIMGMWMNVFLGGYFNKTRRFR